MMYQPDCNVESVVAVWIKVGQVQKQVFIWCLFFSLSGMDDQKSKKVGKNAVVAKLVTLNDLSPVDIIMIATVLIAKAGDSERVRNVANSTCTA
jgi:hypothetical protein